jgi:predicted AAA+ superfamily ATPase
MAALSGSRRVFLGRLEAGGASPPSAVPRGLTAVEGGVEVDFVVKTGRRFVGIEAKAKPSLAPADFRGLRSIRELSGLKRRIIVYEGLRPQRTQVGIDLLPVRAFVGALETGSVW